jgi:peptidoglycan/xylan/chitin deacetylase (PgdA/CDA1 family)
MPSTATTLWGRAIDKAGNLLLQPPVGGLGRVWMHGPRDHKRVALTYDDGPNMPSTHDVLDVLHAKNVPATFFCVGVNAENHPAVIRRIDAEGHIIGNHSMHHSRVAGLRLHDDAHIDDCSHLLTNMIGKRPLLYRAPWGWLTPWEMRRLLARGLSVIGWDVYTYDWQTPPPEGQAIADGIAQDVRPGSIILLHDGIAGVEIAEKPETACATEAAIDCLRQEGYEFVTIPELLTLEPYQPLSVGMT